MPENRRGGKKRDTYQAVVSKVLPVVKGLDVLISAHSDSYRHAKSVTAGRQCI